MHMQKILKAICWDFGKTLKNHDSSSQSESQSVHSLSVDSQQSELISIILFNKPTVVIRCLFIIYFTLTALCGIAQTGSISGIVLDKQTRIPLAGATVSIFTKGDSVAKAQTVTDSIGAFSFETIPANAQLIEISFIGFEASRKTIAQRPSSLGVIFLQASKELLKEVTVTAERSTLVHELDKKVYYVG